MATKLPFISVVVPTYGRPRQLARCLGALARLDYPRDRFEVLVADDGSETPLDDVVAPLSQKIDLTLLPQAHAGPATARNRGAALARGEFLAFLDDDCQPAPSWLKALAERLVTAPDCALGGQTLNALPENVYASASELLTAYLYEHHGAKGSSPSFFASNNLALPAEGFRRVGGFDTSFRLAAGEDREFCERWRVSGHPMAYAPEARVFHAHPLTLRSFLQQHCNHGRGAFHFHRVRSAYAEEPVGVEPLSFYWNMLRYPLSRAGIGKSALLSALILASQAANALGFFWERFRSR